MAGLLSNFRNTLILSLVLAGVMIFAFGRVSPGGFDLSFWQAVARWSHVGFGILWIGLLYYFNFVQIRVMPTIPGELKPAVTKYIAPEALFWFRWAALATVVAGLAILGLRGHGYAMEVMSFGLAGGVVQGDQGYMLLGVGVWLAIVMFLNVWGVIWPNQKRALGIVVVDDDKKAKAARVAMLGSRTNLLLSLPMLTSMAMYQTLFG
ncbi:membrane protein [Brevundimonas bacteroides]|uniref:membrane protein n=1 Tax=Brevundimonas bacteroides TaxID=74311 RepID=UPI000494E33F|nr:membrane protein [Brevundimonas bacteroides]